MAKRYQLPHPLWYFPLQALKEERAEGMEFRRRRDGPFQLYVSVQEPLSYMESWTTVSEREFRSADPLLDSIPLVMDRVLSAVGTGASVPGLIETRRESCIISAPDWDVLSWFIVEHLQWRDGGLAVLRHAESWYLHLPKPSIWTLEQSREKLLEAGAGIFRQWKGLPNLFWKEGIRPADSAWDNDVTLPEGRFLIDEKSGVRHLPIEGWRRVVTMSIPENARRQEREFSAYPAISVILRLAKSVGERPVGLLSGSDPEILLEASRRFSWEDLELVTCWGTTDGRYYLHSSNPTASWRFLQERLERYSLWTPYVFIPAGTRLVPGLDEESLGILFEDWQLPARTPVVIEDHGDTVRLVVLPREHSHTLQDHIEFTCADQLSVGQLGSELNGSIAAFIAENPPLTHAGPEPLPPMMKSHHSQPGTPSGEALSDRSGTENGASSKTAVQTEVTDSSEASDQSKSPAAEHTDSEDQKQSIYALDVFAEAEALDRETAQQKSAALLASLRESDGISQVLEEISALQYALGDRVQSLVSWAEAMPLDSFPMGWSRYRLHPYWQGQKITGDFAARLAEVESRQLPAEPHYCAVALLCLDHNEENQFATLQKQMFRDFFSGQDHPYGELDPAGRTRARVRAVWTEESMRLWNLVEVQLQEGLRAFAQVQLRHLLQIRGLSDESGQPAGNTPDFKESAEDAEIISVLSSWIETGELSSDNARLNEWIDTARVLASFSSENDTAKQLFSFIPGDSVLERLLSRYQRMVDEGIDNRETLFPRETNKTQLIMNNKILLDLSDLYGTLREFQRILVSMPEEVGDEPLDCADAALRLILTLMYTVEPEEQVALRQRWIPQLISHLHYPATVAARQGWLFVLALVWQAPHAEKEEYFSVFGEKLAALRKETALLQEWSHIITVIQGSIMYSSAAEEITLSISELQRRSRWAQCARSLLNRSFSELVSQWKDEVNRS